MLKISNKEFRSRLLLGTGKFYSSSIMIKSVQESETENGDISYRKNQFQ